MSYLDEPPMDAPRGGARTERWALLAVLGVVALLLASLAVPHAFQALAERKTRDTVPLPPPLKPSPAGEFRGIALQLHSYYSGIPFEKYVEEIARTGANTICFSLAAFQENCASNSLFIEYRKVPSVERIAKLIKLAHDRKLRVVIMPIVLLENAGPTEWRGAIKPPQLQAWWDDYESYILFYARLAQECRAEVFLVGSELVSMESETKRWRQLIGKVRKAYKGLLCYSANWDHYKDIEWWGDLDLVGMTTYHDLVGDKKPSLEVLMESWRPIREKVLAWQKKIRRPILFTEVGWPSQQGCAKEPWNYYGSKIPDVATQARCFQAFFETWKNQKAVGGVLIWEWRNHPPSKSDEVPEECSFVPRGKPAMNVIQEYFKSPGALARLEATTSPASHTATRPVGE